jgi:hypothetical protein
MLRKHIISLSIVSVIFMTPLTAQNFKIGLESGLSYSHTSSHFNGRRNSLGLGVNFFVPLNMNSNFVISASSMRNGFITPSNAWNTYNKINLEYLSFSGHYQTFFMKNKRLGVGFGVFGATNIIAKERTYFAPPKEKIGVGNYLGNYEKHKYGYLMEVSYIVFKKETWLISANLRYFRDLNNNKKITYFSNTNTTFSSFVLTLGVAHQISGNPTQP